MAQNPFHLLFPSRHICLTLWMEQYILECLDCQANQLHTLSPTYFQCNATHPRWKLTNDKINSIIFVITSSDATASRYHPIPLVHRIIMLERFCSQLSSWFVVKCRLVCVPHSHKKKSFVKFLLKHVWQQTERTLLLDHNNTVVLTSTPSLALNFATEGYHILHAELDPTVASEFLSRILESQSLPSQCFLTSRPHEIISFIGTQQSHIHSTLPTDEPKNKMQKIQVFASHITCATSHSYTSIIQNSEHSSHASFGNQTTLNIPTWIRRLLSPISISLFRDYPELISKIRTLFNPIIPSIELNQVKNLSENKIRDQILENVTFDSKQDEANVQSEQPNPDQFQSSTQLQQSSKNNKFAELESIDSISLHVVPFIHTSGNMLHIGVHLF